MYATAHILEHIYPHCIECAETSGQRARNGRRCQQSPASKSKRGQAKKQRTQAPHLTERRRKDSGRRAKHRRSAGDWQAWWITSHGWAQRQMGSAPGPDACPFLLGLREQLVGCSHRKVDNSPHVSHRHRQQHLDAEHMHPVPHGEPQLPTSTPRPVPCR